MGRWIFSNSLQLSRAECRRRLVQEVEMALGQRFDGGSVSLLVVWERRGEAFITQNPKVRTQCPSRILSVLAELKEESLSLVLIGL
jgi:hypothetical protein